MGCAWVGSYSDVVSAALRRGARRAVRFDVELRREVPGERVGKARKARGVPELPAHGLPRVTHTE